MNNKIYFYTTNGFTRQDGVTVNFENKTFAKNGNYSYYGASCIELKDYYELTHLIECLKKKGFDEVKGNDYEKETKEIDT